MSYIKQKQSNVTLGYCEAKPEDCNNADLLADNLLRLARFSRNVMSRKENKFAMCIQANGEWINYIA